MRILKTMNFILIKIVDNGERCEERCG